MTKNLSQTTEEIITEILMSHEKKPWLILEGISDETFFLTKKLPLTLNTIPAFGWENVVAIVSKVLEENITDSVFGFIDRDYREELGIEVNEDMIVISDFRDLEISMFESEALHKILVELGSSDKLPQLECGTIDINNIKNSIYAIASKIGALRYYSLKERLNYKLKDLNFTKFICKKTLTINNNHLIAQINSISKSKINTEILDAAFNVPLPDRLQDVRNLCCGHDVIELLGISLRRLWGTNNSGVVDKKMLSAHFRIGYPESEFKSTNMYQKLSSIMKI